MITTQLLAAAVTGLFGGLAASAVMSGYQGAVARLFGQDPNPDNPANAKAAEDVTRLTTGHGLRTKSNRERAGSAVHYITGAVLGIVYAVLAHWWPLATALFGVAYGVMVAVVLDYGAVPAFGWGEWPWKTDVLTHAYGLSSHAVFGLALEGTRRTFESLW